MQNSSMYQKKILHIRGKLAQTVAQKMQVPNIEGERHNNSSFNVQVQGLFSRTKSSAVRR